MRFKCTEDGFDIALKVYDFYKPSKKDDTHYWCSTDYSFKNLGIFNYCGKGTQILSSEDVVLLERELTRLVEDQFTKEKWVRFSEPDFEFCLKPKQSFNENEEKYDNSIDDIYLEWRVYFWDEYGSTSSYLSICLGKENIKSLRDYLRKVIYKENGKH